MTSAIGEVDGARFSGGVCEVPNEEFRCPASEVLLRLASTGA
jgi:hypothetical protein